MIQIHHHISPKCPKIMLSQPCWMPGLFASLWSVQVKALVPQSSFTMMNGRYITQIPECLCEFFVRIRVLTRGVVLKKYTIAMYNQKSSTLKFFVPLTEFAHYTLNYMERPLLYCTGEAFNPFEFIYNYVNQKCQFHE